MVRPVYAGPKTWKAWTSAEIARLRQLRGAGQTLPQCAAILGRTLSSVTSKACEVGAPSTWEKNIDRRAQWLALFSDHPDWTEAQFAAVMGVGLDCVNRTRWLLRRSGLKLPGRRRVKSK